MLDSINSVSTIFLRLVHEFYDTKFHQDHNDNDTICSYFVVEVELPRQNYNQL